MGKPATRSVLYRLIEAGQLARKALLVPLHERRLEAGDDAVLFLLHNKLGAREADVADALGLDAALLEPRLQRLAEHDLVARRAVGPELAPGLALTERGERMRELLEEHWVALEEALMAELSAKARKKLRKNLRRFVDLLRLGS